MIRYTYLMIDIFSVLVPLAASFHPASSLYKRWPVLLPVIAATAIVYCAWDSWFTRMGLWGFNPRFLVGHYIGNLPVEEVLFFICIPYACVFTYDSLGRIAGNLKFSGKLSIFNYCFAGALLGLAIINSTKYYSVAAFVLLAALILFANYKKPLWLLRFYVIYAILLVPFMIVNGLLTGTGLSAPVVWYSSNAILGPRLLTIPVEDIFYGMGLVLINVWLYEGFRKDKQKTVDISITK